MLTLEKIYEALLRNPTKANYLLVQKRLKEDLDATATLDLLSFERQISNICSGEEQSLSSVESVHQSINSLAGRWMISPRFHQLIADFSIWEGDLEQRDLSLFEAKCCLRGLLSTGDGSGRAPYLATYATDIRDVCNALNLKLTAQHLVERDGDWFDLASTSNGEVWFSCPAIRSPLVPTSANH